MKTFQVSQQYKTEQPVEAPKSLEPESREDFPGFTEVQFMQSLKGSWELQMRMNLLLVIVKGLDESHKFGAPTFFLLLLLATYNFVYTVVSQKSTHGYSTVKVCQRGGRALFQVFSLLTMKEHPPMSCLAQLNVLEANNWTNNNVIEPPVD